MEPFEKQPEMHQQVESDGAITKSENTTTTSVESKRKLAAKTGKFYNSLINIYLEFDTQRTSKNKLLNSLMHYLVQ